MSQESIVPPYDQSWTISIFIDELDSDYSIRVKDSTDVSRLIKDLINRINLKFDWTEYGLWCLTKNIWLLPKSSSLLSFGLHSDSKVHFVRRYKLIKIQLPDLQIREIVLDLSKTVFQTTNIVCRKFGIRHHEELSFQYRKVKVSKHRASSLMSLKRMTNFSSQQEIIRSNLSLRRNNHQYTPKLKRRDTTSFFRSFSNPQTKDLPKLRHKGATTPSLAVSFGSNLENTLDKSENELTYYESFENSKLSNSPDVCFQKAVKNNDIFVFKNFRDRSYSMFPWMISELTLMEQGIINFDEVVFLLRFKYHNYFYLDERYDTIRINQIFNQAYWSVLSNETDCLDDEALILGGIFLQVKKSTEKEKDVNGNSLESTSVKLDLNEEINMMLDKMHLELLGKCEEVVESIVEVSGMVHIIRYPKRFFNSLEKHYAELKDDGIYLFPKQKSFNHLKPTEIIPIKGNEMELRIKLSKKEYFILEIINLKYDDESIKKERKMDEKYKFKFLDKNEFCRWATGCRLLSKSIDFSKLSNFQYEYHTVTNIIDMKRPKMIMEMNIIDLEREDINLSDFIPSRMNKPFKRKYILEKLIELQRSCSHYSSVQSKIAYIKCWLTLRNAGVVYFQVVMNKITEKILLGLGYNRLIKADLEDGKLRKIWELSKLMTWNTNWELKYCDLEFPSEKLRIDFVDISNCQTFHEYLGGYFFIMMRNSEKYSDLGEKTFRKLTARNISRT